MRRWASLLAALLLASGCGGEGGGPAASFERPPVPLADGPDPLYSTQWHLKNRGQVRELPWRAGEDANVEPVWASGVKGEGVVVGVVDDGLEVWHEDLAPNVMVGLGLDFVAGGTDPGPGEHGTAVAGIVGARDLNGVGLRGVAPRAGLAGFNLVRRPTVQNLAAAMTRHPDRVHVRNNSWGFSRSVGDLVPVTPLWRDAIETGLARGRNGLGTIYVFSAGNGFEQDDVNYKGHLTTRGVIPVSGILPDGTLARYSARGAAVLTCAPSSFVATTHRTEPEGPFQTSPYAAISGTSAAAPIVSGVVALLLEANPGLGWRDVRLILAATARKNDPTDPDWSTNGAGFPVNHKYGFGAVDAAEAVEAARAWRNVGPERVHRTPRAAPRLAIPDGDPAGVADTLLVAESGIGELEYVEVDFAAGDHPYAGDLEITLVNETTGTTSRLARLRRCQPDAGGEACVPFTGWTFGSVRHLGEPADGRWTLRVVDRRAEHAGTFEAWGLRLYGR